MLPFELASYFFAIEDVVAVSLTNKESYVRAEEMFRRHVFSVAKIIDDNWIELFLSDKIEPYGHKHVAHELIQLLNHREFSTKISWKIYALMIAINFSVYPTQFVKNPVFRSGTQNIALRAPLSTLLYQHEQTMKKLTSQRAAFQCMESKMQHTMEENILKIKNMSNILQRLPVALQSVHKNVHKRNRNDNCIAVKRLCMSFGKKTSVIKTLSLTLDRETNIVNRKLAVLERLEKRLHLLNGGIKTIRTLKYALTNTTHQRSIKQLYLL